MMLCSKPYRKGVEEYGCGQCMPCRINRRRLWVSRLLLESKLYDRSYFVTLTYDEAHVPVDKSLVPRDVTLFLKRLRKSVPYKLRYFAVGEYGDISGRPHYHVMLFGLLDPSKVALAWEVGFVHVGEVTPESCNYICGYACKGWTLPNVALKGRHPEFVRMSLKPGIGGDAVPLIAERLVTDYGSRSIALAGDVPSELRFGGKRQPLGRYLRKRLRKACGFAEVSEPKGISEIRARALQVELSELGNRRKREEKRSQHKSIAETRVKFVRAKKGVGL